jgi:hypothetical protein
VLVALEIWVGAAGVPTLGNGASVGLGAVAAILDLVLALGPKVSQAVTLPPIRTIASAAPTRTPTRDLTAAKTGSSRTGCSAACSRLRSSGCGVSPLPANSSGSAGRGALALSCALVPSASRAERAARRLALGFVARGRLRRFTFAGELSGSARRGALALRYDLIPAASSSSRLGRSGEMGGDHVLCKALVIPRQYHSNFCCTSTERGSWWRNCRQSRYWRVATILRIGSSRHSFSSSSAGTGM